jgi:hypothetical protein
VKRGWRKLHNEELHNLYSSPSIFRMIKTWRIQMGRERSRNGGEEEGMSDIGGKDKRKVAPKKINTREGDNVKTDLRDIE